MLDYFAAQDLDHIFAWEAGERFERTTERFLKHLSAELAFPIGKISHQSAL